MTDTAKLFVNGNSQAVRLPKSYRFPNNRGEVFISKDPLTGDVILSVKDSDGWSMLFDLIDQGVPDDFLCDREQGVAEERVGLDD